MSVALKQFEAMIEEMTQGLSSDDAARVRDQIMDNPSLNRYYAKEGTIAVTIDDQIVETLPCERVAFEYPRQDPDDPSHWQAGYRGQATLARTRNGDLWAFMDTGPIFHSSDGGRTWAWTRGSSDTASKDFTFTVLQDDSFLVVGCTEGSRSLQVHRSTDLGETWERIAAIDPPCPFVVIDDDTPAMTQLSDGTILFETQVHGQEDGRRVDSCIICRSTDGGKTWSSHVLVWEANRFHPDAPEFPACGPETEMIRGETHILELAGGRLLQTVRFQSLPGGDPWAHISKQALLLDSDDGGLTWKNARPTFDVGGKPVLENGECHGWSAQLPDGRIVMVHDRRYPHPEGQTIAHVSHDEGKTWDRRAYHLIMGCGYPATVALEDGTIVTVSGAGLSDETGQPRTSRRLWTPVAVRWKLPA